MRKNRMMRLASALLILTMVTTCAISGTFAKYTTTTTSVDSARVAKWGFNATTINITDLFAAAYTNVNSESGDVIAPGTEGKTTIQFAPQSGTTPEVAYAMSVVASSTKGIAGNPIVDNNNIKWALYKTGTAEDAITWGEFSELLTSITGLSEAKVEANNLPKLNDEYVVAWKWIFNTDDVADAVDTAMGNAAGLAEIDLTITITATQLD